MVFSVHSVCKNTVKLTIKNYFIFLGVWEYLLECRIKLQNGLVACNNLPPSNNLLKAKKDLNSEDQLNLSKCKKNLLILLGKMVDLQVSSLYEIILFLFYTVI